MTPTTRRNALGATLPALGACAAFALLAGCSGAGQTRAYVPEPAARWARWSQPDFASLNRETLFILAPSPDRDTLIFDQTQVGDQYLPSPRTWLITLPETRSMLTPIEIAADGSENGWLLASIGADPVEAFPAHGRISVLSSDAESLTAQVNISAVIGPATAGYSGPQVISLDARLVFVNMIPQTAQPTHPATTSGVPFRPPEKAPRAPRQ